MDSRRFPQFFPRQFLEELERRDTPAFAALPSFTTGITTPTVLAAGDFNRDGFADIAVGNDASRGSPPTAPSVSIDLGNGDGTFTVAQTITDPDLSTPESIAVADLNHDGIPDLAIGSFTGVDGLIVLLGNGNGTFTKPAFSDNIPAIAVAAADFNGDGNQDLVALLPESGPADSGYQIFLGNGKGGFTALPEQGATANISRIVTGDFDNDGHQDFMLLDSSDHLLIPFFGDGTGNFTTPAPGFIGLDNTPSDLAAGDFNRDGLTDLVVAESTNLIFIPNLGNRSFDGSGIPITKNFVTGPSEIRLVSADVNRDGVPDVIAVDPYNFDAQVFTSNDDGTFNADPDSPYALSGGVFYDVAAGDINGDGNNDFVVTMLNADGTPSQGVVFVNQAPIPTKTVLSAAPNPARENSPVTFTAKVNFMGMSFPAGETPTGSVSFSIDGTTVATVPVANGQATFTDAGFPMGMETIVATYSGDGNFELSNSAPLTLPVNSPNVTYQYQVTGLPTVPGIGADRVASGNFTPDGASDILLGSGGGRPAEITIIDGNSRQPLADLEPFGADFTGGVMVAAGDIDGDGTTDMAVTADAGGGPRVQIYLTRPAPGGGIQLVPSVSFYALDSTFRGGLRIALGDVNGDGFADLVVTGGPGSGPRVAVYDGRTLLPGMTPERLFNDFFAMDENFRLGLFVAVGDLNGDGFAEIAVSSDAGGGPRVEVFDGHSLLAGVPEKVADFYSGDPDSRGGVRIAIRNITGEADGLQLITGDGPGTGSTVRVYSGTDVYSNPTPTELFENEAFPGFDGGVYVA